MGQRLPLFESLAAILAVLSVAVLTALPAKPQDAGGMDLDLHDRLGVLRTAVFRFSMDHERNGAPLHPGRDGADVSAQLVGRSDREGVTGLAAGSHDDRYFGPYLQEIPENPVNGSDEIRSMPASVEEPVLNGSAGWVYVPATGEIFPDLPGSDARGVAYREY